MTMAQARAFFSERFGKVDQDDPEPATALRKGSTMSPYDALMAKAADLRRIDPTLSQHQAFAKAYSHYRDLADADRLERRTAMFKAFTKRDVAKDSSSSKPIANRVASLAAALCRQHKDMSHDSAIQAVLSRNSDLAAALQREQAAS
jgi:hypothetical protein